MNARSLTMEALRILLPLVILAAGIFGFVTFGAPPEPAGESPPAARPPLVRTEEARRSPDGFVLEIEGVSTPFREIRLAAEVAGRIVEKGENSRAGSYVQAGELLYRIDDTDYTLEVQRLADQLRQSDEDLKAVDVDLENTRALITLAEEDLELRKRELKRREDLRKKSAGSDSELDEARRQELAARNALLTLRNQVSTLTQRKSTLQAARELVNTQKRAAEVDRDRTVVRSPVHGLVITDSVEENDYVRVGDPLLRLNDSSRMEVMCSLRLEELFWIWDNAGILTEEPASPESRLEIPETEVEVVFFRDGQESIWDGVLSRYEGTGVDPETRTVPCRVLVAEPTRIRQKDHLPSGRTLQLPTLFAGMYVEVRIPVRPEVPLLVLPDTAVRPGSEVWVVRDGKLERKPVAIARVEGHRVFVHGAASGLAAGDRLVTTPLPSVHDGMAVEEETR